MSIPPDTVRFIDHHLPALPADDYRITVTQTIELDPTPLRTERTFTVAGERFTLAPDLVRAVFPPDGSLGDHSHVLPHVVLNRSTLPWERSPDSGPDAGGGVDGPVPWLALLLFTGAEQPEPRVLPLAQAVGAQPYLPAPRAADGAENVTVIDVPWTLLRDLLPTRTDLPYLAHVRRGDGPDAAVVVGNRLPAAGTSSTVHLVSLESRYTTAGTFDQGPAGDAATVRLVSLLSWRFACLDADATFGRLVARLGDAGAPLRLPDSGEPRADTFLRQGYVPVRHRLRAGGRSIAWYRGPLAIGPTPPEPDPDRGPVRAADQVLRYHADTGTFDVSHAVAWQTGRLLALRSTGFAAALHAWKRRRDQAHKRAGQLSADYPLDVAHLDVVLPDTVTDWLAGLLRLDGVPFTCLVPDERLLPVESVRFFHLDQEWLRHLVDGAYSLGRVTATDADLDASHPLPVDTPLVTGALIRSDVVAGYPGLLVDGFADADGTRPLAPAYLARLAPSVLLCLFPGDVARLDVHQQPESLHFGVTVPGDGTLTCRLRGADDSGPDAGELAPPLPLGTAGTVPVRQLATAIATQLGTDPAAFTAGDLARQLIETGERVTFLRGE